MESVDLVGDLSLFDSDIVEVLLLDGLLLNGSFLEFKLDPSLFLFNLSKFTLNITVVNSTVLIGLDLLEKCSLLGKLILTCSLSSSRGRHVLLSGYILGL